jgi:hypothetical protein
MAEELEAIAVERAKAELDNDRVRWRQEQQERVLGIKERESALRHREQMQLQAEWRGTLKLFRSVMFTVVLVLALGQLATGGARGIELLRLGRVSADWIAGFISQL